MAIESSIAIKNLLCYLKTLPKFTVMATVYMLL